MRHTWGSVQFEWFRKAVWGYSMFSRPVDGCPGHASRVTQVHACPRDVGQNGVDDAMGKRALGVIAYDSLDLCRSMDVV